MVAQLKELADLVGNQRDVRMKAAGERGSFGRGSRIPASALADNDLRDATDIVSKAADTIAEMARRNQELEAAASRAVLHYKAETEAANKRNMELTAQLDAVQDEFHAQVAELQRRNEDLQSRLTAALASLEEKTQDIDFANEWLSYLSSEIRKRLADAPKKLTEMSREVRARRFEYQGE